MTALDDCDEIYYPQLELEKENLGYLGGLFLDLMMAIDILQSCFLRGTVFHFPFTKYSRITLVFVWNSALLENFYFYFSRAFC